MEFLLQLSTVIYALINGVVAVGGYVDASLFHRSGRPFILKIGQIVFPGYFIGYGLWVLLNIEIRGAK